MKLFLDGREVDDYVVEFDYISGPGDFEGFIRWAVFTDGTEATDEEIDRLEEKYPDAIYEAAQELR